MTSAVKPHALALLLLAVMLTLMFASAWNDSATMDELAHIPAGFGYVTQFDYRLNPEHPPLVKALAAFAAEIVVRPYFPTDTPDWRDDVNGQWGQGTKFLYESGNDADRIIFWSRAPLILLTVFFGWLFYRWTRARFGKRTTFFALTLFAFSPTLLTHGRLVTTDMGAAFGFFLGIASFIAFLEKPDVKRITIAGILLGIALLLKFSVVLLIPVYAILIIAWMMTTPNLYWHERIRMLTRLGYKTFVIGIIGIFVISLVYGIFVWRYPAERQVRDAEFLLGSYGSRPAVELNLALIKNPLTRPFGEYLLGLLMVQQRSQGGNTAYFLGEVSAAGSRWYFPLLYLLKEPLPFHILTLIALVSASRGRSTLSFFRKLSVERIRRWIALHFPEFSALVFIAVYWAASIQSPLNIGIRHVLPTFPFIYLLVSRRLADSLMQNRVSDPKNWGEWLRGLYDTYVASIPRYILLAALLVWLASETIAVFPSFLSYYNQLAGGTANGWRIAVDSNYDWGQDMKRLADVTRENNIQKIAVDYFGGASPGYYLGERFEPWWSSRGPAHGWFAISSSARQSAYGAPAPGFFRNPEDSYKWLTPHAPVARAGRSIFIYNLP